MLDLLRQEKAKKYAKARLTDQNLAVAQPSHWIELLTYDHPSYHKRVDHARYYSTHNLNQQSEG